MNNGDKNGQTASSVRWLQVGRTVTVILEGTSAVIQKLVAEFVRRSASMNLEPYPDDRWAFAFKAESGLLEAALQTLGAPATLGEGQTFRPADQAELSDADRDDGDAAPLVLQRYVVSVSRIGYGARDIEVEASGVAEASDKALDVAGNFEYSEHSSDYEVHGVTLNGVGH